MKFEDLNLHPSLLEGILKVCQFKESTEIQEKVIPFVLKGKDVAGLSQTGTGKTAAYVIPVIERILRSKALLSFPDNHVKGTNSVLEESSKNASYAQDLSWTKEESSRRDISSAPFPNWRGSSFVLVLVPTRELAIQVHGEIEKLGSTSSIVSVLLYGGISPEDQKKSLQREFDFVVATPGRLIDFCKEGLLSLNQVCAVIFDEADRLFDMGFKDDAKYVLRRISKKRQILVFSATLNFDVFNMMYSFGSNPIEVNMGRDSVKAENVEDKIFHVGEGEKPRYLLSLFKEGFFQKPVQQTIVFSNFKHNVERISRFLIQNHIPSTSISSLLTQKQRNDIVCAFRSNRGPNVLVATDVAARGLDIKGVDMVVNYELPDNPENYVHRVGRTGRAGALGLAFSLVSDLDLEALHRIEEYLSHKLTLGWLKDEDLVQVDMKEWERQNEQSFLLKPKKGASYRKRRGRSSFRSKLRGIGSSFSRSSYRKNRSSKKHSSQVEREDLGERGEASKKKLPSQKAFHRDRHLGRHKHEDEEKRTFSLKKKKKSETRSKKLSGLKERVRKSSSSKNGKRMKRTEKAQNKWRQKFYEWVKRVLSFKD